MRVGVLMQHLLTGTLLVTSVLGGGLNSERDSEQPFNRTRPCQPQSLPIETSSISATTDGNSILCAGRSMFPQRLYVRGSSSVIDLGRITVKRGAARYEQRGQAYRIEKDHSGHGGTAWKLYDPKGRRVASLTLSGYILRID